MVHQVLLEDDMNLSQGSLEPQMSSPYRRVAAVSLGKIPTTSALTQLAGHAEQSHGWT